MQFTPEINMILIPGISYGRNRAIYQRPRYLSERVKLTLFLRSGAPLPDDIAHHCSVRSIPKLGAIRFLSWLLFDRIFYTLYLVSLLLFRKNLVVYTFHRNGFSAGAILKLIKGKKMKWIVDMQHTPFYYFDAAKDHYKSIHRRMYYWLIGLIYISIAKISLHKADLVFSMSFGIEGGFAKIMSIVFNVPDSRLFPIPNGVDINLVERYKEIKSLSKPYCFSRLKMVYAGNVRRERLRMIISFTTSLQEYIEEVTVFICGSISSSAKRVLNKSGLLDVRFLGFIPHEDLMKLYNDMDVALILIDNRMRDHRYSHPGKLFESMAMGKVVVVSDLESTNELIRDGENGILMKENDFHMTAQKLYNLIRVPQQRAQMERTAEKRIRELDWQVLNKKWYRRLLQEILPVEG